MEAKPKDDTPEKCYTVAWPSLCDDCGQDLALKAMKRTDLDALISYCPHTATLALAFTEDVEGQRTIVRWDVQSPITTDQAIEVMNEMSPHASCMVNLDKESLN